MADEIWTIGHSNRGLTVFLDLLQEFNIETVVDVRSFPGSRKWPQFNRESLSAALQAIGCRYLHLPGLGGRRTRRTKHSHNTAWRVASFNAYADHMEDSTFLADLDRLQKAARDSRSTLMCAEALPWRCHRRLIADALIVRGWQVWDILGQAQIRRHELTPFARVEGQQVYYPGGQLFPE
jgi:uncharacterized protein (DUF488 family)